MFWKSIETIKEQTLQQIVKDPNTSLDDVLNHDYCFQELRVESPYLVEYFTRPEILKELLSRSLFIRPSSKADPLLQYKAAPRALGVLTLGCKPVNNALISNPELVKSCLNYLEPSENSCANYVTTGFYKRFIISMLITFETDESKFLDALEKSNFMDLCFGSMRFGGIAEMIVRIPSHCSNLNVQKRLFDWYAKEGVAKRLVDLYTKDASMEVLENAGFIWSEFNEMQLRHIETSESFTNSLYSAEIVKSLVERAFLPVNDSSPMLINSIAPILVSFIELNRTADEPGYKVFPDQYMREPTLDLGDPEFSFQTEIAFCSKEIMQVIVKALEVPISSGCTLTAVSCLRVIRALTNSNHKETHSRLAAVFAEDDTSIFKLLDYAVRNPTSSICNNHIMAIVAHILFSNTTKEHLLIDSIFNADKTIIGYIIDVLKKHEIRDEGETRLDHLARQSFFLKIGEYVNASRSEGCERSNHLSELIQSESDSAKKWDEITKSILHTFSESNKTTYSLSNLSGSQFNQTFADNMIDIEIDEISVEVDTTKDIQTLAL